MLPARGGRANRRAGVGAGVADDADAAHQPDAEQRRGHGQPADRAVAGQRAVGRAADGALTGYGTVGWLAAGCTLLAIWLARRIRIVAGQALR